MLPDIQYTNINDCCRIFGTRISLFWFQTTKSCRVVTFFKTPVLVLLTSSFSDILNFSQRKSDPDCHNPLQQFNNIVYFTKLSNTLKFISKSPDCARWKLISLRISQIMLKIKNLIWTNNTFCIQGLSESLNQINIFYFAILSWRTRGSGTISSIGNLQNQVNIIKSYYC